LNATPEPRRWDDAVLAATLFAIDPRTGGISLRALPGPVRDRYLALVRALLPSAPLRLPLHISDDRLLGGIDLQATLMSGFPIVARGLLAEADGGVVLLAIAERLPAATAAQICHTLDRGEVVAERDGLALRSKAAIGVVALDEGLADEAPPAALLDRLAFHVDLTEVSLGETILTSPICDIQAARARLDSVLLPDDLLTALCGTASSLGVASMRALLLAVRVARAAAAFRGQAAVTDQDAIAAARLVLAPRATVQPADIAPTPPERTDPAASQEDTGEGHGDGERSDVPPKIDQPLGDIMLAACRAAMPDGLLAQLATRKLKRLGTRTVGRAGAMAASRQRGRPIGTRAGALRAGARLNLIDTLRAAAPWQKLRHRDVSPELPDRVIVTTDDFRITRFRHRTETTTIFVVDASGSAALARLAEAKGAVELVLADCYVRRDKVALIAFRGTTAELLLPPTGSLVRAKSCLAGLPGGGGTPLATGLDAAAVLADAVRRKGQTPAIILFSDGRANIARDGSIGRAAGETDALAAGRMLRAAAVACIVVDTSPRPAPGAKRLAAEMGALYLPLPYADAATLSRAVRGAAA
jgi:magnesium chelatase subunit D